MYSFGPLPRQKRSGNVIGTHQKIDRIARRHLNELLGKPAEFPAAKEILHFEGSRGPDGVKLKSPGKDEPWHFIDPTKPHEGPLIGTIQDHHDNLVTALRAKDMIRAAFEAAWLAHAVTDGLTPAHQDNYAEQLAEMGNDHTERKSVRQKIIVGGTSKRAVIKNNWDYWGTKGILTTHTLFEGGVATATKPFKFKTGLPSQHDLEELRVDGFEALYLRLVTEVASLHMYDEFKRTGWTSRLARETNNDLLPRIIVAVTLAWYSALMEANRGTN